MVAVYSLYGSTKKVPQLHGDAIASKEWLDKAVIVVHMAIRHIHGTGFNILLRMTNDDTNTHNCEYCSEHALHCHDDYNNSQLHRVVVSVFCSAHSTTAMDNALQKYIVVKELLVIHRSTADNSRCMCGI